MRSINYKKSIFIISMIIILVIAFSNIYINKVFADQPGSTTTDAIVTTADASITTDTSTYTSVPTSRKAPVSIQNYSNVVTESADTYDYLSRPTTAPTDSYQLLNATQEPVSQETTPSVAPPVATAAPSNNNTSTSITNFVIIGDSRTVGMKQSVGEKGHKWSCKSAMGLDWTKSTGVPQVESSIGQGTAVIILMGVNDLFNQDKYITYINQKAIEWSAKGAKTYYVSVNPINESTYKGFKNTKIEDFNSKMQAGLKNVEYIDTYNYLITHDCNYTSDGLHYKASTYKKIYELIMDSFSSYA